MYEAPREVYEKFFVHKKKYSRKKSVLFKKCETIRF